MEFQASGKATSTSLISAATRRLSPLYILHYRQMSSLIGACLSRNSSSASLASIPTGSLLSVSRLHSPPASPILFRAYLSSHHFSSLILNLLFSFTPLPLHSSQLDTPSFHLNLGPSSSVAPYDHVVVKRKKEKEKLNSEKSSVATYSRESPRQSSLRGSHGSLELVKLRDAASRHCATRGWAWRWLYLAED
ncbi:hypothetical protein E2C01_041566 [Portunus trituberculatus]|uniref:Uncharacterized protein n=1 Tax=Portunus trituberculatus TaxID=210409 RepID=A0A5B7FRA2_PORTR|nr:hypothetical protein [Portunus trituberculatus]